MPRHQDSETHEQLLTVRAASDRLALGIRTVWALIADGTLTPYRFGKRATRVSAKEVDQLIDRARQARR